MIRVAVLTISDSCFSGKRKDQSGMAIQDFFEEQEEFSVTHYEFLPDEKNLIIRRLNTLADSGEIDLILTTGGTGLGPRDVTPEATMAVIDREVQGIAELMRQKTSSKTMNAYLSRARAGLRKKCIIINFPGSLKGATECLDAVFPILAHAFAMIRGEGH